jgi:branched-chain amino acid aminotransferase
VSPPPDAPPQALLETMLARHGRVPWLARHLARMEASAHALGIPWPGRDDVAGAVTAAVREVPGRGRVRLVLDAAGARAEASPEPGSEPPWRGAAAVSVRGGWDPRSRRAEHKALPRRRWDRAQAAAEAAGADHALLLDAGGRLGEAAVGNVFAVVAGDLVPAPAEGLLAGVARAVVRERLPVREEALVETVWREAEELFLTNAVRGVVPLTAVDGRPVGAGVPGPVAARARDALRQSLR